MKRPKNNQQLIDIMESHGLSAQEVADMVCLSVQTIRQACYSEKWLSKKTLDQAKKEGFRVVTKRTLRDLFRETEG